MQESKRQKQVGALLLQELSGIFQRLGLGMMDGGLVSLTAVKVTPDLLEARVYLSMLKVKDVPAAMKKIEERGWEIKRELASRVKHQLRRMPILEYFYDDSLEHADKMEALFRKISEEKARGEMGLGEDRVRREEELGEDRARGEEGDGEKTRGKAGGHKGEKPRGEEGPA